MMLMHSAAPAVDLSNSRLTLALQQPFSQPRSTNFVRPSGVSKARSVFPVKLVANNTGRMCGLIFSNLTQYVLFPSMRTYRFLGLP